MNFVTVETVDEVLKVALDLEPATVSVDTQPDISRKAAEQTPAR